MYQKEMWMGHIAQGIGANYLEFAGGSSQDLESYSTSGSLNRKPDLPGLGHKVGSFKRNAHQNILEWSYPSDSSFPALESFFILLLSSCLPTYIEMTM